MRTLYASIVGLFVASVWAVAAEQAPSAVKPRESGKPAAKPAHPQKTCPVTGKPVKRDIFVEQDGLKVYFCCDGCPPKFKASPDKYLPAVYREIYPQTVQTKCPVTGEPIKAGSFIMEKGERIYFCCNNCPKKFRAEAAVYLAKVKEWRTDQVHCPVTGTAIDPKISADYKGQKVYFSSADAMKAFSAAPDKYAGRLLPEGGVLARGATADDDLILCPVCADGGGGEHKRKGMKTVAHDGKTYYFCSSSCVDEFKADPAKFVKLTDDEMKKRQGGSDQEYTCPMHPDVRQKGPGKCPKCGMDLVPAKAAEAKKAP
jgi:YHS domain-containing protein